MLLGVDRRRRSAFVVHVAEQRDLALERRTDRPVRPTHDRVGLDTDAPELANRVLGRLGLELLGGGPCTARA